MLQNTSSTIKPKVVVIRRRANQGFGFTLRHFIAYPPEDDPSWPHQEATNSYQVKAMETIFIKEVQPNGPAHFANLQTGDRVLMVNNAPIAGIAYSTIVSMIKMTPSVLTLHVVPKECDVLQMQYTSIAHTSESNRLAAVSISRPISSPLTVGNSNAASALVPFNSTSKSFPLLQRPPQKQMISYHPVPMHAIIDGVGSGAVGGNGGSGGGANAIIGGNASRSSSVVSNSSGQRSVPPLPQTRGVMPNAGHGELNELQQSLHHEALLMRGDVGYMRSQPQNLTVLTRPQNQQLHNPNSIYASGGTADTNDLMIRLRESIKQKEEFLKSPLPLATQHQLPHQQHQQQQQQHFFPQHALSLPLPAAPQSASSTGPISQLSMVSSGTSLSSTRGQLRTLVKHQPLPATISSSSSSSATKDLLSLAGCDMSNFYNKRSMTNFDNSIQRDSGILSRNTSGSGEHNAASSGGNVGSFIQQPYNPNALYATVTPRNHQRAILATPENMNGLDNIAWDKYSKDLDFLESLPETGVTNQVFERKLVSHLAKGFDPFKPLSINTNATAMTESPHPASASSNVITIKKQPVLYESLQHHPLHQLHLKQQHQSMQAQMTSTPTRNVVDGQQTSRMEVHKANLAKTIDYPPIISKYSTSSLHTDDKPAVVGIPESKDGQSCSQAANGSASAGTEGVVVRRNKPVASSYQYDDSKPMRRISYLRATNNENDFRTETSSNDSASTTTTTTKVTTTTATTVTTAKTTTTTATVTITTSSSSSKNTSGNSGPANVQAIETASSLDVNLDEPAYEVVGIERNRNGTPLSGVGAESRRSSVNSELRSSIHIDNEFIAKVEKDISTEMDHFETEMEIKSPCINGKRIPEYRSWRQVKIEIKGDILKVYPTRSSKSENNVIELDIKNFNIYDESVEKKKYIFRLQSKPQTQQQPSVNSSGVGSIVSELNLDDGNDKLVSSGSSSSTSGIALEGQNTEILFKTKSMTEMKRIYGLLQWKCSLIYCESDIQGKQLAEPQKIAATSSVTTTDCDEGEQRQQPQIQIQSDSSPPNSSSARICVVSGDLENISDSISPVMKTRKSSSHKSIPDKDLGSPKAKNWKDLLFRRGGNHGADISPSNLSSNGKTIGSIGVPLKLCPMSKSNEFVPHIVDICTNIVETKGLGIVGIYRIPGNKAAISELSDQVNRPDFSWDRCNADVRWEDVNVVSSLLKLFIRSLPDALLPSSFYINFIEADKKFGLSRLQELKELLESLPRHSYETMKHLIRHLSRVSKNCAVNLMEPKNLAIIFGPSIIRTPNDTLEIAVKDMKHQCRIVELLLTQYEYFFENGDTPDVADITGNVSNTATAVSCGVATNSVHNQEDQTNMLLHNVAKIERLTDREQSSSSSSKTSRFIPNLRRRTHSKRSAVSSDTYSGESVLSLDYNTKMTSSSSTNSSTTATTSATVSSTDSKKGIMGRIHHRKSSLDEKDSGSASGGSCKEKLKQQRSSVDISILLTDEESSNSRISDSGSMSLTTITDALDSKLRNLRSGSESNDENDDSPEFLAETCRHTFGQPLHLYSENIPYADESPERLYHHVPLSHPSGGYLLEGPATSSMLSSASSSSTAEKDLDHQSLKLSAGPTPQSFHPHQRLLQQQQHQQQRTNNDINKIKSNHKLQHSATVPISVVLAASLPPVAASTPIAAAMKSGKSTKGVAASSTISNTGRNLRFSSVYEQCCSEDDSEGSTTSDPKESALIITSPAAFLDRYNKKRRDHRLFRSASFNCRNYSTRTMQNSNAALTKDEKTDMNLTKKRQIQNKQNRSIKRRHTVGGPHDYTSNATTATNGSGNKGIVACASAGNQCHIHCKQGVTTIPLVVTQPITATTNVLRRLPIPSANGNISNNQQQQLQTSNNNINNNMNTNNNGNGSAAAGEHVFEVGIRIKNINRGRY